jgi:hypothetical protein
MGQLWSPEALVYVYLYLSVLAVCIGVTFVLVSIHGLGTREDTEHPRSGRASWVALLIACFVGVVFAGVVLANVFGQAFPAPLPPWDPGVVMWALISPRTGLDLLGMCVLLILVGLSLKSGSGRAAWLALLIALFVGVVLANLSGQNFPPLNPCWGVLGCPPWNPGPFGPPIGTLLHTYPLAVLAILGMCVLLSLVGFVLAWRTRGRPTLVVVRGLQLAPLLAVALIGLAALFLFPLPYAL